MKKLLPIKKFVIIQLIFWILYAAAALYAFGNGIESAYDALAGFALFFIPGFCITSLYRYYLQKQKIDFTLIKKIIPVLFVALCIHFLVLVSFQLLYNKLHPRGGDLFQGVGMWVFFTSVFIVVAIINLPWYFVYHIYQYIKAFHQKQIEVLLYREENTKLQIENLTNKLNPHFLFNTLNTIRWLTDKENTGARNAINNLSEILRYNFTNLGKELVTIEEELEIVEKYLSFEKIRFEERLEYSIKCITDIFSYKIVPFSILNLVENSIKHGISQLTDGGKIDIIAASKDSNIIIEIINTGRLTNTENKGFGIESLNKIFAHVYQNNSSIQIENNNNNEVVVKISIPRK